MKLPTCSANHHPMLQITPEIRACQCTISAPPGVAIEGGLRDEIDHQVRKGGGWKKMAAAAQAPRRRPDLQPELLPDLPPRQPRRRKAVA